MTNTPQLTDEMIQIILAEISPKYIGQEFNNNTIASMAADIVLNYIKMTRNNKEGILEHVKTLPEKMQVLYARAYYYLINNSYLFTKYNDNLNNRTQHSM